MILRTRACFAYLTSIPAMQLVNVFFQGEDDVLWTSNGFIEGLRRVSVFFTVWWGLVLAFCWETLISWPVVSYASRPALIASSYEMGSQWLGAWMGWTSGSRSRSTGGPRKPRPWKSEVQFLEMNSRVQVPNVGQTRMDVSGVVEEVQLLIPDGCQVQSAVAGEGYLWNVSLWSPHVELAHQVLCLPLNWIRLVGQF